MILKLIVLLYAWVWNVTPWQPTKEEDWIGVIILSLFADGGAVMGIAFLICSLLKRRA